MNIQEQLEFNSIFEDLLPVGSKNVAVVIGRFNPPTRGHYAVINLVKKFIRTNKKLGLEAAPAVVIIGGSKSDADKKRNPLSVEDRQLFMTASGQADGVQFFNAPNAFAALKSLREKGLEPIAVAAGTDRLGEYITILDKYFTTDDGKPIPHHKILLSRDEDAIDTNAENKKAAMDAALTSMKDGKQIDTDEVSGSLARRAVELGYHAEFAQIVGLEHKPALAKKMFAKIKASLAE